MLLWLGAAACAWPGVTPPAALLAGLAFALLVGNSDAKRAAVVQKYLLQASVVGMGFGVSFGAVVKAGSTGLGATALSLLATIGLGWGLARLLKVEPVTGNLISVGTAICGGSAIAAMGPVLGASAGAMSVALGCVFMLNAVALFAFPPIGHAVGLTAEQFGWWAAVAIHDTSSVVGAAARFSSEALAVAVPVKLARALWILPLVAFAAWRSQRGSTKPVVPWFVALFIGASLLTALVPEAQRLYRVLSDAARSGLSVTLFLIGAGLSRSVIAAVGWRPLIFGVLLWLIVSAVSLGVITWGG